MARVHILIENKHKIKYIAIIWQFHFNILTLSFISHYSSLDATLINYETNLPVRFWIELT